MTIANRKFGVEIEINGLHTNGAADVLNAVNIECRSEGYHHETRAYWKTVTDSSVSGCEVVSPPMSGEEGVREVRKVARALARGGASVDRRCGLHVHVDAAGLSVSDVCNIIERYSAFESNIDAFIPQSRRGSNNGFCGSLGYYNNDNFRNATSIRQLATVVYERGSKINIQSYAQHGTIEFRHHSGTINASKIEHWIRFCVNFVEMSREVNMYTGGVETSNNDTPAPDRRIRVTQKLIKLAGYLQSQVGINGHIEHARAKRISEYSSNTSYLRNLNRLCDDYGWEFNNGRIITIGSMPMQAADRHRNTAHEPSAELRALAEIFTTNPRRDLRPDVFAGTGYQGSSLRDAATRLCYEYGFDINYDSWNITYYCRGVGNIEESNVVPNFVPPQGAVRITDDIWSRGLPQITIAYYNERASDLAS